MQGLTQLLAFADAVGSNRGLLLSCLPNLDDLCYDLGHKTCRSADSPVQFELEPDAAYLVNINGVLHYYHGSSNSSDGYSWYVPTWNPSNNTTRLKVKVSCVNHGGRSPILCRLMFKLRLSAVLAAATEALLFLAHKLQLPDLQQALHHFIRINSRKCSSKKLPASTKFLFVEQPSWLSTILSDRVLDAAAGNKQFLRQFMADSFRGTQ